MARGINKVILIGNLGADPKVHAKEGGSSFTTLSLATCETWKDKNSGEQKQRTEWHKIIFFKRLGEVAAEYLKKGAKIFVEGKLQTRKWQDKNGQDLYTTEIIANEMQMLDSRHSSNSSGGNYNQQQSVPQQQQPTTHNQSALTIDNFDDDILF